ncbi:MAG: putative metal-dependent hydrolase [Planctomycetes bacterium]|nr:putative metal-dependent hydrolase [Planctomycetota bacterium]
MTTTSSARSVDPRYPIGKIELPARLEPAARAAAIARIAAVPAALYDAVRGLDAAQLDTPYRAGGWTLRQVVHHVADSHVNAYVRCKLTLTEKAPPPIKAYDEAAWAQLADANGPIGSSLLIVQSIHDRWVHCLRSLPEKAFTRTCVHSERGVMTLDDLVALYAWHGSHHVAHITSLRLAKGW